jgi:hypothetical protein
VTGSDLGAGRPRSDEHRPSPKANTRQLLTPLERLAKRICHAANARGTSDVGATIAAYKQRASIRVVKGAIDLAIANQWLRFDGVTYTLTQAGAELGGQPRRGPRKRRVTPF